MTLFSLIAVEHTDDEPLPKYSDPGRILFNVYLTPNEKPEYEVLAYDGDASTVWLQEGVGCDYALAEYFNLNIELEGTYVLEGITGEYHRGDGYTTDDDEDWYCGNLRRASDREIQDGCLYEGIA